eukprot:3692431-Rhodomonas_salina.1
MQTVTWGKRNNCQDALVPVECPFRKADKVEQEVDDPVVHLCWEPPGVDLGQVPRKDPVYESRMSCSPVFSIGGVYCVPGPLFIFFVALKELPCLWVSDAHIFVLLGPEANLVVERGRNVHPVFAVCHCPEYGDCV